MRLKNLSFKGSINLDDKITVKDFIKIMISINNRNNAYKIVLNNALSDGRRNMILYWEGNKIKSHHSSGYKFEYEEIMNSKIQPYYFEQKIEVENIKSMECDYDCKVENENTLIKVDKKNIHKILNETIEELEINIAKHEKIDKIRNLVFEENIGINELKLCIQQFLKDFKDECNKNSKLECEVNYLKHKQEDLKQQIKWLEYRLNNKI